MDAVQERAEAVQAEQPQQVSQVAYGCYIGSLFSVLLSLFIWFRASGDAEAKATTQRFAIFVGLWPPTLAVVGKVLEDRARAEGAMR